MNINPDDYLTGIQLIDEQHIYYIEMVINFVKCYENGNMTKTKLIKYLNDIAVYLVEHLDAEEYLMRAENYPLYNKHLGKHNLFRAKLDIFREEINKVNLDMPAFFIQLSKWLIVWFKKHAQDDDIKLAKFLNMNK